MCLHIPHHTTALQPSRHSPQINSDVRKCCCGLQLCPSGKKTLCFLNTLWRPGKIIIGQLNRGTARFSSPGCRAQHFQHPPEQDAATRAAGQNRGDCPTRHPSSHLRAVNDTSVSNTQQGMTDPCYFIRLDLLPGIKLQHRKCIISIGKKKKKKKRTKRKVGTFLPFSHLITHQMFFCF